ncbi:MAG TPA: rhodanese-like domain-containing protein, partial [Bacteroidales bacterium]|nr:rhodanese-like domain-containing protein [Bacteroidales bacterium]
MKKYLFSIFLIIPVILTSCGNNQTSLKETGKEQAVTPAKQPVAIGAETQLLLKDLKENGDYVNSKDYPSLIKAAIVHENLGKNIHVIDIRTPEQFTQGHIKGAVSKKFGDLPAYFETGIKPFKFDKIVIVSEDGSLASYTTSLLRLMGYSNVYAMRWGMSAWNSDYAKKGWLKDVSGKYEDKLQTMENLRIAGTSLPELNTGLSAGPEIATAMFKKLFEEGTANVLITADEVFANPSAYYIINLERKDKYEDGHIPGAIRYKPESTLGFPEEMSSIPADKTVVVYCGTGHNSGFATAYLRLFGYNARTLRYGNNGFMHDRMIKKRTALSWLPFSTEDVNDFEVVK